MDLTGIFILFFIIGIIGFVLRLVLVGMAVKKGGDYLRNFDRAIAEQQQLLQNVKNGSVSSAQVHAQFLTAFLQAQNEMQQMNQLQRERSQLKMSQMLSDAAQAGLIINPSSIGL